MVRTKMLSPLDAVKMTWAYTVSFAEEKTSEKISSLIEKWLEKVTKYDEEQKNKIEDDIKYDKKEREYLNRLIISMSATLRNLNASYKGRKLNFKENKILRSAYIEAVKFDIEAGRNLKDFLNNLPGVLIGSAAGALTSWGLFDEFQPLITGGIIVLFAFIGFLVNRGIIKMSINKKGRLYVAQDYERNLYFIQYLKKCKEVLLDLFKKLEDIHKDVFGNPYYKSKSLKNKPIDIIVEMVDLQQPTLCEHVHEHFSKGKITPHLWTICETDNEDAKKCCPYWLEM